MLHLFDVTGAAVSYAAVGDYGACAFTSSSLSSLLCSWSHPHSSDKRQAGINTRGVVSADHPSRCMCGRDPVAICLA